MYRYRGGLNRAKKGARKKQITSRGGLYGLVMAGFGLFDQKCPRRDHARVSLSDVFFGVATRNLPGRAIPGASPACRGASRSIKIGLLPAKSGRTEAVYGTLFFCRRA